MVKIVNVRLCVYFATIIFKKKDGFPEKKAGLFLEDVEDHLKRSL